MPTPGGCVVKQPGLVPARRNLAQGAVVPLGLPFILAHVPLGLVMSADARVATVHALVSLGVGLFWAAGGRPIGYVAAVGAYIAGAEVLWRMTGAGVFYEYGKYTTVLVFLVALIRRGALKVPRGPLAYFLLLLPSVPFTMAAMDLLDARAQISFNLSGPLSLMVCAWFFSRSRLTLEEMLQVLMTALGPLLATGAVAALSTARTTALEFSANSNFDTSGGFGPNQVSAALGLGALLAIMGAMLFGRSRVFRTTMVVLAIPLAFQSALTFSRGGLWAAGIATAVLLFLLARDQRARIVVVAMTILLAAAAFYAVPRLDSFTGGAFTNRFSSVDATGRDRMARSDLSIWMENPVLGVGPGVANEERERFIGARVGAHTEYSRLLAEHGILGALALVLLLFSAWSNIWRQRSAKYRAIVGSLTAWSLVIMAIGAMRTVSVGFAIGVGFATVLPAVRRQFRRGAVPAGAPDRGHGWVLGTQTGVAVKPVPVGGGPLAS